jgi:hypothetical protein
MKGDETDAIVIVEDAACLAQSASPGHYCFNA